jgi:hypothetical protein
MAPMQTLMIKLTLKQQMLFIAVVSAAIGLLQAAVFTFADHGCCTAPWRRVSRCR